MANLNAAWRAADGTSSVIKQRLAGRIESRLLHFREKVFRIAVEFHYPHINQRADFMQPDLGEIERVVGQFGRVLFSAMTCTLSIHFGKSPFSMHS